jgi:hypothetical protein
MCGVIGAHARLVLHISRARVRVTCTSILLAMHMNRATNHSPVLHGFHQLLDLSKGTKEEETLIKFK